MANSNRWTMTFYYRPLSFDLSWKDEGQYLRAVEFLKKLVGGPTPVFNPGGEVTHPLFYYLNTAEQHDALMKFHRETS